MYDLIRIVPISLVATYVQMLYLTTPFNYDTYPVHICTRTRLCRVSLDLTNIQSTITGGVAVCSSQEVGVAFDKRRIISLYEVIVRFPQEDNKLEEGRKKLKFKLERERNPVL